MPDEALFCFNHPERAALEPCEICGKPLCGYCLYYTEDGQRLCEIHAQAAKTSGLKIIPPAIYANGIIPSQAEVSTESEKSKNKGVFDSRKHAIYQGNNQDLNGFLAMFMGISALLSCCYVTPCLFPFAAVLLGILSLVNAKDAVDPRRTRQQAWIGILTGGCLAVVVVGIIGFYVFAYGTFLASVNNWNSNNTPFFFSTSTSTPYTPYTFVTDTPRPIQATQTARARNAEETPTPRP